MWAINCGKGICSQYTKHTSIRIEYKMKNNNQLLWCWNRNIPWESGQYHSCWWQGWGEYQIYEYEYKYEYL